MNTFISILDWVIAILTIAGLGLSIHTYWTLGNKDLIKGITLALNLTLTNPKRYLTNFIGYVATIVFTLVFFHYNMELSAWVWLIGLPVSAMFQTIAYVNRKRYIA